MADVVNFGKVQSELKEAGVFMTFQTLQRDSKWNARNQLPRVLLLTDRGIYYGGTETSNNNFFRIPLETVMSVEIKGVSFWRCLEIVYRHDGRERRTYLCPFEGDPSKPRIDVEVLANLRERIKERLI